MYIETKFFRQVWLYIPNVACRWKFLYCTSNIFKAVLITNVCKTKHKSSQGCVDIFNVRSLKFYVWNADIMLLIFLTKLCTYSKTVCNWKHTEAFHHFTLTMTQHSNIFFCGKKENLEGATSLESQFTFSYCLV